MIDDEDELLCDVWGDCEPFDEQAHLTIGDCQYCGGVRYHVNGRWMTWTSAIQDYVDHHRITGYSQGMILDDHLPERFVPCKTPTSATISA
ncbi:hypothetical protein HOU03_gp544 [Caulobacter phage CcrSC]|uniref:Uncharacterized protein n=1 Tax=Caulobacter phage CcrSC TaxID=2283272 RepID=A0A385ED71_9CAUD|nr:hypothetical protein HOU03_gp544 [Caulobacter phage CcrSC]AXQ69723.1 hypothetical protein CcrSC_gp141 [Caulobacter phage CcrSC]